MSGPRVDRRILITAGAGAIGAVSTLRLLQTTSAVLAADTPGPTEGEIQTIIANAVKAANATASGDGLRSDKKATPPVKRATKMIIAIVARSGELLRVYEMPDAWVGSRDIAIAKARTAAFFSSDENALTSRVVGVLSQPGGALWGIGNSNQVGISGGPNQRNGIITFPGGVPLYQGGHLIGGVGVSGDGVDQDEFVAFGGATGFAPGAGVVPLGLTPPRVAPYP